MPDPLDTPCPLTPDRWEARYREGTARWDLGEAPPALRSLLADLREEGLHVFVPGAGYGHDAIAWAAAGHAVVAVDYAPSAVEGARALAREKDVRLDVLAADIFDLPDALRNRFDVVWEQTCFCAVKPEQRAAYVDVMANVLRDAGTFYGLFWNHGEAGGPPFDITPEIVRACFAPRFRIESSEPVLESAAGRNEFFTRMTRR